MKNTLKINKTSSPKRIKCILLCFLGLGLSLASAQSDYQKAIEKHREEYKADFLKDERSPLSAEDLNYLDFFIAKEAYRVTCRFKATKGGEPFEIPTSSGKTKTFAKFGQLSFKISGKKHRLVVYRSLALINNPLYKDYLFVPFKDATSGQDTYGGGRYLDLRMREFEEGEVILDFNKAYNPYCAFSIGYSCPIPPKENRLSIKIEAGEKNFLKDAY
ncbi:MAG: hypothetical protein ACI9DJ_000354 [Algoriphagus sp.]|jgi:uncharacterized protein (DUF1684 family)